MAAAAGIRVGFVLRRAAFGIGLVILAAYLFLVGILVFYSRPLIYHPGGLHPDPASLGLDGFSTVSIPTVDGETLVALWAPPKPDGPVVLRFHGNGGFDPATAQNLRELAAAGFGVLAPEWRGYGGSTGQPTEAGLRIDGRTAYDFIRARAPHARIAVIGESLGSGVAVGLALERDVAGILLESPYASMVREFEHFGPPGLPYGVLMPDTWDSLARIGRIRVPVMIIAGTADTLIPVGESRLLFAAAGEPKTMIEIEGARHVEAWRKGARDRAIAALLDWTAPRPVLDPGRGSP